MLVVHHGKKEGSDFEMKRGVLSRFCDTFTEKITIMFGTKHEALVLKNNTRLLCVSSDRCHHLLTL